MVEVSPGFARAYECDISLGEKVAYERFADNRTLSSMILIDRVTNQTSGCAVIEQAIREAPEHLKPDAAQLFFEIGETQGERLGKFALSEGFFTSVSILPDQYGVPRLLYAART